MTELKFKAWDRYFATVVEVLGLDLQTRSARVVPVGQRAGANVYTQGFGDLYIWQDDGKHDDLTPDDFSRMYGRCMGCHWFSGADGTCDHCGFGYPHHDYNGLRPHEVPSCDIYRSKEERNPLEPPKEEIVHDPFTGDWYRSTPYIGF